MSLKQQIGDVCFAAAVSLFNVYEAFTSNWQESSSDSAPSGTLLSAEAIIAAMEALHTIHVLDVGNEDLASFWRHPVRRAAYREASQEISDCRGNESSPYLDFASTDNLGEGFAGDLPANFRTYTETLCLKIKTGMLANRMQSIFKNEDFKFVTSKLRRVNVLGQLTELHSALVARMQDRNTDDAEYGWSYAHWEENVNPLPGEDLDANSRYSVPYYTFQALDTMVAACTDVDLRSDSEFMSEEDLQALTRIRRWLEGTLIVPGPHGDVQNEELNLGALGFNVAETSLRLYDNLYAIGSWLSVALCQELLGSDGVSDMDTRDRVRNGLLFIAKTCLEAKYAYSDADQSLPEFVFRLAGTHWKRRKDVEPAQTPVHTKLFQDRAIHAYCLKALARYLRLFPERDAAVEDALHQVGNYVLWLRRGGDARGAGIWERHRYSFYYTNRALASVAELGTLIAEHNEFDELPAFREARSVVDLGFEGDGGTSSVRDELRRIFAQFADLLGEPHDRGQAMETKDFQTLRGALMREINAEINDRTSELRDDYMQQIADLQTQLTDQSLKVNEAVKAVDTIKKRVRRAEHSGKEPPDLNADRKNK